MVCRTAVLTHVPGVEEVTEEDESYWSTMLKKRITWMQPLLVSHYNVWLDYDFGFCCGLDGHLETFATVEAAEAMILKILTGKHEWISMPKEGMEGLDMRPESW